ncbi:MAG: SDR family NAD(P)-dependent oxidoreductase, partial [Actinobacteria bacterium]|nr:SDR family NAD(P)-dependent oxidoreductase [Actinomycetota bacterium]
MAPLRGKRILVTGAGSGIGRATARLLAEDGALVLCADIARETADAIGGEAYLLDVTDPDSWARIFDAVETIDGLVNCAGIEAPDDTVEQCTAQDWERVMQVNLDGVFLGTQAAIKSMLDNGTPGSIVNISSVLAIVGDGETLAYGASKAAVVGLTRSAALAVAANGIRCNTVHPAYIRTPMTERWLERPDDLGEATLAAA